MTDEPWTRRANHATSRTRAVGGKLTIEGDDLVFRPHGVDRALAATDWSVPLRDVRRFGTVGPSLLDVFSGGLRSRLSVETPDGTHLFVLGRPKAVAEELRGLVGG